MRREHVYGFLMTVALLSLLFFGTRACREWRIDRCEDRGGTAVVPPWFSNDPAGVSCLQSR